MSESNITRCEFVEEVENAAREARKKGSALDWQGTLAAAYAQTSLELRRIVHRHIERCPICRENEALSLAKAPIASLEVTQ